MFRKTSEPEQFSWPPLLHRPTLVVLGSRSSLYQHVDLHKSKFAGLHVKMTLRICTKSTYLCLFTHFLHHWPNMVLFTRLRDERNCCWIFRNMVLLACLFNLIGSCANLFSSVNVNIGCKGTIFRSGGIFLFVQQQGIFYWTHLWFLFWILSFLYTVFYSETF